MNLTQEQLHRALALNAEYEKALREILETNASQHGTLGMMVARCMDIARKALGE